LSQEAKDKTADRGPPDAALFVKAATKKSEKRPCPAEGMAFAVGRRV
jgi:hypothetical protein